MADHATYVVRMAQGCDRLQRRGKNVVIPKNKEMERELDDTLEKQDNDCNLCFGGLTFCAARAHSCRAGGQGEEAGKDHCGGDRAASR